MRLKYNVDSVYLQEFNKYNILVLIGWSIADRDISADDYVVRLDGKEIKIETILVQRNDVFNLYKNKYSKLDKCGYTIRATLPSDKKYEKVELFIKTDDKEQRLYYKQFKKLYTNKSERIVYNIDYKAATDNMIEIAGWALAINSDDDVSYRIVDENDKAVEYVLRKISRKDVIDRLDGNNNEMCGFDIRFMYEKEKRYKLHFIYKRDNITEKINPKKLYVATGVMGNIKKTLVKINRKRMKNAILYIKENGVRQAVTHMRERLNDEESISYEKWFERHKADKNELEAQRKHKFSYSPMISILVPTYNTPENFLCEMIDSVIKQTYVNWELCIADGNSSSKEIEKVLKKYSDKDDRVKYIMLSENKGISDNTNAALELAKGEFIGLLDHDDLLAPNALYEIIKAINENENVDVIYTDEDKISIDLKTHFQPHFKPDFNIDLLRSNNYICHFFVVRKKIADNIGGFRSEYDGSQDYDFIFRCTDMARNIVHVPKILYYWRMHQNSVAENPQSKMYAFEAGKRAIENNLTTHGIKGQVEHLEILGFYRVRYEVKGTPKVSIIIPNKDEKDTLKTCVESILNKTTYQYYNIIIVENNSETTEIFDYYKKLEKNHKIKIIYWQGEFNYSAINNYGVQYSDGEYIVLLNNDTEVINGTWLEEMLGVCQREDVGIVGAKLLYPDDTVQHAGVIIGSGGIANHAMTGLNKDDPGYFAKAIIQQDLSAVTAACLMIKEKVFVEVGGLEEKLRVAFNDVDLCLKVGKKGYKIVYNPFALLYHYESKSRGKEDNLDKILRFENEIKYMECKWKDILENGDPYYNKNLSLRANDCYGLD